MGTCIICSTSTDGPVCEVHEEDVAFEFEGDRPDQLTPGRFYKGTVDGYAEFGVFIDIGPVTGLLHRSKLDRRIESLEWERGDTIYVQVENVRDNGDIDLGWSIRQTDREFRGVVVDAPDGDYIAERDDPEPESKSDPVVSSQPKSTSGSESEPADTSTTESEPADTSTTESEPADTSTTESEPADTSTTESESESDRDTNSIPSATAREDDTDTEPDHVEIGTLRDRVGEVVRLEGEIVSVRQTSGPTVFELRDETGVVDCAAFVEAGVRAYPDIEADAVVRLDGEVRLRRDEIQIETGSIVELDDDGRAAVERRMDEALDEEAAPASSEPLVDDDAIAAADEAITEAATAIRRAVFESRPVVIRHDATTDGYVAGAAIERAVLPLVEDQHNASDAIYHYFDRRPLEDGVYDMNDATKDVTRMLGDRERHDEKLPLFVFAAAGSTPASADGLEMLEVYDAPRIVVDGRTAAETLLDDADTFVTVEDRSAATVAATVAAAINDDIREDLYHLPAVSYWDDVPAGYEKLAADAGVDAETARSLRAAVALKAYYQSYEDKRELIVDLLFGKRTGLAEQVAGQFDRKLESEIDTALANIENREIDGVPVAVLDTDAYTHRFDFPPTRLLLDELHRRLDAAAVVGVATDELHVRSDEPLDLSAVVATLSEAAPNAGVVDPGARQPKLEFLAGEREAVLDAVVDAVAEQITAASA